MMFLSCSGGKDSTAAGLFLLENGIEFSTFFCDVGWEAPETYAYLSETLPRYFGEILWLRAIVPWQESVELASYRGAPKAERQAAEREAALRLATTLEEYAQELEGLLGFYSPFVRLCLKKAGFPSGPSRWCTESLKVDPARSYLAQMDDPTEVLGIRAEESKDRANLPEHDWSDKLDCAVWRPLIRWSAQDVFDIHKKHDVPPNPMYLRGAYRVGCFPCIFSRKAEIGLLDPIRTEVIRRLEEMVSALWHHRVSDRKHEDVNGKPPTFFQSERRNTDGSWSYPIEQVVQWSRTDRKGKTIELFEAKQRDAGCMRWGLCDTGAK